MLIVHIQTHHARSVLIMHIRAHRACLELEPCRVRVHKTARRRDDNTSSQEALDQQLASFRSEYHDDRESI